MFKITVCNVDNLSEKERKDLISMLSYNKSFFESYIYEKRQEKTKNRIEELKRLSKLKDLYNELKDVKNQLTLLGVSKEALIKEKILPLDYFC